MKKWLNYLPTIFILSIVLSLVFYSSQGSTVQMNYTQFEKIVDEVDFKKSSMTISSTVIHLEGTYEQNSKTVGYKVIVPRTEKNIEKLEKSLQRNGGKLTVEDPNQGSVWISILSQIIPFKPCPEKTSRKVNAPSLMLFVNPRGQFGRSNWNL